MIGELNWNDKRATIIGAGISGLLIGYTLKKKGFQIRILEKSHRAGGLIETKKTSFGIVETAAHSLLITPEMKLWFDEIGVDLIPVHPESRARFIYRNGKMRKLPLSLFELLETIIRFFSKPKAPLSAHPSLAEWCRAYLGEPALKYLLAPFVTGVFAARPEELDTSIAFPMLIPRAPDQSLFSHLRALRKNRRARPQMMAPRFGMEDVIEKLRKHLENDILLQAEVTALPDSPNLILSVPSQQLASHIRAIDPHSAQLLEAIHYSPLITATAFYSKASFKKPPQGVGVLIPRGEGLRLLGVLFNSSAFSDRTNSGEVVSLTVMLGGTQDPDALKLSDAEVRKLIEQETGALLGASGEPLHVEISRWEKAIPIYSKHLAETQKSLTQNLCKKPGFLVFTNYSRSVSIRGLFDSLQQV